MIMVSRVSSDKVSGGSLESIRAFLNRFQNLQIVPLPCTQKDIRRETIYASCMFSLKVEKDAFLDSFDISSQKYHYFLNGGVLHYALREILSKESVK